MTAGGSPGYALWTFDGSVVSNGSGSGFLVDGNEGTSVVSRPQPNQLMIDQGTTIDPGLGWSVNPGSIDAVFSPPLTGEAQEGEVV